MLDDKLKEYAKTDIYPFHMPGHKRVTLDDWNPYQTDITEIDGFDNLHHAKEILLHAQNRASQLYGSKECCYLVNGSTCGILAAISAAVKKHGKILVARNSHKAVYNGILLRELDVVYTYPEIAQVGIQGQISATAIDDLLENEPDVEAVLITSPTYDGVVSDVAAIAEVVHKHNLPLIVDAAHGAHFGFSKGFPENPIRLGADIVIESVHKTLPAFTQTALLHICSNRVSVEKIKKYLKVYETSSPSYVLMAGIDRCISYLEAHGEEAFAGLENNLTILYDRAKQLKNLYVLQKEDLSKEEAFDFDYSKVLIFSRHPQVSGNDLHQILLEKYHLQMEMVSGKYVLALCSVMDSAEGFQRLIEALEEIDRSSIFAEITKTECGETEYSKAEHPDMDNIKDFMKIYRVRKVILPIYKVEDLPTEGVSLQQAIGQVAGEYLYLYPPGIPVIVPGEEITEELIEDIKDCQKAGLTVEGLADENRICIVNFS